MCKYCGLENYTGENLDYDVEVDGSKQDYEIFVLDDLDYNRYSLNILGTYSDIRVKINYCPMCGNKLNY